MNKKNIKNVNNYPIVVKPVKSIPASPSTYNSKWYRAVQEFLKKNIKFAVLDNVTDKRQAHSAYCSITRLKRIYNLNIKVYLRCMGSEYRVYLENLSLSKNLNLKDRREATDGNQDNTNRQN